MTKTCVRCGTNYTAASNRQIYCSPRCRWGERQCEGCGKSFSPSKNAAGRFCSQICFYDSTVPVGSVRHGDRGYMIVKVPRGTPGGKLSGNRKSHWMWQHRYVMQESLGRPLISEESVHHINGKRDDNRLENLQLRSGRHGNGAAFRCLDCGSHNVEAVPIAV